jgi:colanic acid/amylovoran biosynthesis glycosyltransferase
LKPADLVLCHFGPVGLRAAKALAHDPRPAIWTIFHGNDLSAFLKRFGARAYRSLFDRGELFFGVSRLWMARLKELGCPADRVRLMRMGVDVDAIEFHPREPDADRPLRFLTVGRLVEKKGIDVALRALAELRRLRPGLDWTYEIAGDGPLRSRLERLCEELQLRDRVTFSGKQSPAAIQSRLGMSDLFLLPSVTAANGDMEGIPVSLMEAMAAGVPVLSTFHSGIPELIEDGVSGLLAPERDHVALAENICRLLEEPGLRAGLVSAARDKVEREFNQSRLWDDLVAEIRARVSA